MAEPIGEAVARETREVHERYCCQAKKARQNHAPTQPFRGAPSFWNELEWDEEKRIQAFTDNFVSVGAHIVRVKNLEEASTFITTKANELGAKYVIRQNEQELDELQLEAELPEVQISVWNSKPDENWKARAAEADIGVVMADYATAYTGSVTVLFTGEGTCCEPSANRINHNHSDRTPAYPFGRDTESL